MSTVEQEFGLSAEDAERLVGSLLNSNVIDIFCYGLYTMLFWATMRLIVIRGEWPLQRIVLTSVICVIWVFATAYAAMTWARMYSHFVSHGQSRESVLGYFFWSRARRNILAIQRTLTALNATFADLVNIWRCWVLYDRRTSVVFLPLLGVVCGIISHAFRTVTLLSSSSSESTLANTNWFIVYCSVATATNILTTSLIIYRILSSTGFRGARTYGGTLKIFVESAFFYSATYVVYLAVTVHDFYVPYWAFGNWYIEAFVNSVTAAAPTMILGCVMAGEARINDSWLHTLPHIPTANEQSTVGGLRFASIHPAQTHITATTVDLPRRDNDSVSETPTPATDGVEVNVDKGMQLDGNQN